MNAIAQSPFTIPFFQTNHLILVEAVADGRSGHFILDTGAGDVILNKKHFSALQTGEEVFEDINGQGFRLRTGWVNLSLGALSRKSQHRIALNFEERTIPFRQLRKGAEKNTFMTDKREK